MIDIIYPSGAHGSFLTFLLNYQAGVECYYNNSIIYDKVLYGQNQKFFSYHKKYPRQSNIISIVVDQQSYLKWMAMCLSRTAGINLCIDFIHLDKFYKLNKHMVLKPLLKSLSDISNKAEGNIEKKHLREWTRLCLFDSNTILPILNVSAVEFPNYKFNFEWFYDPIKLKSKCIEIFNLFDIKIVNDITILFDKFYQHNIYKNINVVPENIVNALIAKKNIPIPNLNFLQEAWIDNWLVNNYDIVPLLPDQYFSNTLEIIKQYNLINSKKLVLTNN